MNITGSKEVMVILQGFIEGIPVGNLIMLLNRLKKTGVLLFHFNGINKSLYFKNGNIVFATSNLDDDRLGESLIRNGKITQEQLDLAAKEITPAKKLGKVLVEKGFITAKELFLGVRVQIEEIVVSLFGFNSGYFEFKEENFTETAANIPINLRNTILKGLRKFKKRANLEEYLPSLDVNLEVLGNIVDFEFDSMENEIIKLSRAGNTVREIIHLKGTDSIDAIQRLMDVDVLIPSVRVSGKERDYGEIEELLHNVNAILMDIFSIIKSKSPRKDVHATLNTFFTSISPRFKEIFKDIQLNPDGSIDIRRLIKNHSEIKKKGVDLIHQAISELLQFELFELRHYLNREEEAELMQLLKELKFER